MTDWHWVTIDIPKCCVCGKTTNTMLHYDETDMNVCTNCVANISYNGVLK